MSKQMIVTIVTAVLAGGAGLMGGLLLSGRGQPVDHAVNQQVPQEAIDAAIQRVRAETASAIRAADEKLQITIEQLNHTVESVNRLHTLVEQLKQEKNLLADQLRRLRQVTADPNAAAPAHIPSHNPANTEAAKTITDTSRANTQDVKAKTAAAQAPPDDMIVYVTKTGKKYHRPDCPSLSKSKIPLKLSEAKARGYTPCSRCKPPGL